MGKVCELCARKGLVGNNRSHSNIATKRRQEVNLQVKRIDGVRMRVCARCIRSRSKQQAAV
ncbi:50S ribosomal protein L28 [Candidatus Uhrbacteria bacterium]|nr:50S ribosomal protein L28 [Candidatus Uhrbacteria bacterium]